MQNRREFLERFALLGAVATLPAHHLFAESALTPKPIGDGQFGVSCADAIVPKKQPARKITIPNVGEYKVLKGDFHMHTIYSDGAVQPVARVQESVDNGLDVIAITDHVESSGSRGLTKDVDRNMAYNLAKPEADRRKLLLIHATEVSQKWQGDRDRHFNALFIRDANPIGAVAGNWKAMIAVAAEQGAFIHWNHPGDPPAKDAPDRRKANPFTDELEEARAKGHLHGVEVFNGTWHYPFAHGWCNERDLAPMANSDIHGSEWNTYGHQNPVRPMTLVLAKEQTLDSIREAFFARRVVGWAANMILGRQPWVEKLFRSSVKIEKTAGGLTLQNLSDIPCLIGANGQSSELLAKGTLTIAATNKLTVNNWFVGMNKPLEINLG